MKGWNKSLLTGLVFGAFSIVYLIMAFQVKTASSRFGIFDGGFMPKLYGFIMLICAVVQLGIGIRKAKKDGAEKEELTPEERKRRQKNTTRVACGFLLIFFYIFTVKYLGFILSSAIFLFCLCNLMLPNDVPRTKKLMLGFLVFSIVLPTVSYLFFKKVVFMALPAGTIFKGLFKIIEG